ncbi:hypothetical protein THIOM_000658 [Candidatus Thiomargarita nelsonii]|uniref:Uncharacterized protein n=1 Tax=Candidatus Thiomargarita nelsonii TaxID=1003181 RepID=A0A176S5Y5_9GAMM|nr:hypothetical protein THIOM_000658 [Candidatus Thiomargarita nelsonii]
MRVASSVAGFYKFIGSPVMTFGGSASTVSREEAIVELQQCSPVEGFTPSTFVVLPSANY